MIRSTGCLQVHQSAMCAALRRGLSTATGAGRLVGWCLSWFGSGVPGHPGLGRLSGTCWWGPSWRDIWQRRRVWHGGPELCSMRFSAEMWYPCGSLPGTGEALTLSKTCPTLVQLPERSWGAVGTLSPSQLPLAGVCVARGARGGGCMAGSLVFRGARVRGGTGFDALDPDPELLLNGRCVG